MPFERRGFRGGSRGGFRGGRFGGSRDFGGREDLPKTIKVGEEYDVEINEVGSRGDGIARVKNFVVFVNGAKQGEKAHIKIKEVRNRFAIGEKVGAAETVEEVAEPEEATESEETIETKEEPIKETTEEPVEEIEEES